MDQLAKLSKEELLIRWIPAILFIGFIGWIIIEADLGTQNPLIQFANSLPYGDKIGHAAIYGVMALLVTVASRFRTWNLLGWRFFYGTSLVLLFALLEEGSQYFLTTRNFDLYDGVADMVGIGLASWVLSFWYKQRNRFK